jgi:uncharacterized repeat protein (TIGR01451 family)
MRKLLSVLTIIFLLLPSNTVAVAAPKMQTGTPVPVTITITHVHEIHCDEGLLTPCPNDYYTKVDIDGQGFQRRDWCDNCDKDFRPNWAFTRMVDSSRNPVKLLVELRDRDDSPETDDTIDITAGDNKDLDLTFDLNTCSFQGTGLTAQQGAGIPGNLQGQSAGGGTESAEITFTITTPFCLTNSYNIDSDGDGLFDGWEIAGLDIEDPSLPNNELKVLPVLDGTPDLALPDADPRHIDLFVEVDWMLNDRPENDALTEVIEAFKHAPVDNLDGTNGITLHVVPDETVPSVFDILFDPIRGPKSQDDFDDLKLGKADDPCDGTFGTATDRASSNCAKILAAKKLVFRYGIFGDSYSIMDGGKITSKLGSSGRAELGLRDGSAFGGNDFIVTLGTWGDGLNTAGGKGKAQAATFMHEFGHTLGLDHGGGDDINCKPNYLSVMNYTLQFTNIDKNRPLDYSSKELDNLEEKALNEMKGIGGPSGRLTVYGVGGKKQDPVPADATKIDWNGMNSFETSLVPADINFIDAIEGCSKASPKQTLNGYDDWEHVRYNFRDSGDFADGVRGPTVDELTEDGVLAMTAQADLKVTKSVDKAIAIGGDTLNYSVPVTNLGPGKAINVSLTDTLPDGSTQTRALPDLDKDVSITQMFTFLVPCTTTDGTVFTNNASITGTDESGIPDPALSDNTAQASTTVQTPVLTLTKTAAASVNAGEAITYTINYENTGSGAAANVVITDVLPAGIYYSKALDLGSGPKLDAVTVNADGTRTLTWNVGVVPASSGPQTIVYSARPTLLALGGTSYSNNASLSFQNGNGCVYDILTASAPTSITVVPPTRDPLTLGFWRNHPEQWTAEILARIQATDQRYDTNGDGALAVAEATTMFASGGNQPKVLQMQLLATYFNLATRRINADTMISSKTAPTLGLAKVRDAALFAIDTLLLPVNQKTKTKYDNATGILDEINNNKSEVY